MSGSDRNLLCWCNSGIKYKFCHLDRENKPPLREKEILDIWKKEQNSNRTCLHPNASNDTCKGGIVRAHTIQRSGGLSRIAQDNHVYSFRLPVPKVNVDLSALRPVLTSVKQASTFTGFCQYHDTTLFAPLETRPFQATQEQIGLLAYRAFCREFHAKQFKRRMVPHIRNTDRGKDISSQRSIQAFAADFEAKVEAEIRNMDHHKKVLDESILSEDYTHIQYYMVTIDGSLDIMCSGGMCPFADFKGRKIQELIKRGEPVDFITFSLIATDEGGAAIFAWIGEAPAATSLIDSLDAHIDEEIPDAIIRFCFESLENTYCSPEWWSQLATEEHEALSNRMFGARRSVSEDKADYGCLLDDGIRVASWKVRERIRNISPRF